MHAFDSQPNRSYLYFLAVPEGALEAKSTPPTPCRHKAASLQKAFRPAGIQPMTMFMAVLTVEFSLEGNDNLKAKRRVANSLKQKTRNKFNVAIAEAGTEDSLSRLRLAVVSISNSESHLRSRMDKCALMMEAVCPEEMTDSQVEIYAAD